MTAALITGLSPAGSWAFVLYLIGALAFLIHRFSPGGDRD